MFCEKNETKCVLWTSQENGRLTCTYKGVFMCAHAEWDSLAAFSRGNLSVDQTGRTKCECAPQGYTYFRNKMIVCSLSQGLAAAISAWRMWLARRHEPTFRCPAGEDECTVRNANTFASLIQLCVVANLKKNQLLFEHCRSFVFIFHMQLQHAVTQFLSGSENKTHRRKS